MTESPSAADLYERDFYAWSQAQARELRRFARMRPNVPLDLPHLAEEIADLGKEQRARIDGWAARIMERLLLFEHASADERHRRWACEIVEFRSEIELRLSPTLRANLRRRLPELYADARRVASLKAGADLDPGFAERLPHRCPYRLEQVLTDWWPASGGPGRRVFVSGGTER
jgi:hypothetical protein